jgi:hypothetical protein
MGKGNRQNSDDKSQVIQAGKDEKLARIRELEDLVAVMETEAGRRLVWRLLSRAGVFTSSFTGNSATFFNEGKRDMGLFILAEIMEACDEQYFIMTRENRDA